MEAAYRRVQQAPIAVNRARVYVAANPFLCAVVYYVVFLDVRRQALVKLALIPVHGIRFDGDVVFDLVDVEAIRRQEHKVGDTIVVGPLRAGRIPGRGAPRT